MNRLAFRIMLDFIAVGLFMLALAYWWLDNRVHEFAGTAMFLLLALHNIFNRRWWGGMPKVMRRRSSLIRAILNMTLAVVMLTLLVTSVVISRTVFSFLPIGPAPTAKQIHIIAAYWALIVLSIHLGMHWSMIMATVSNVFELKTPNLIATWILRTVAAALAIAGVWSSSVMGIGSKLIGRASIDFWDFNESYAGFFLHHATIIAMWATTAHLATPWFQRVRK